MKQRLIVEGKDAIVLSVICSKHMPPPKGYANPKVYEKSFVEEAGSYERALTLFKNSLSDTSIENLGIIVDANQVGAAARWQSLKKILDGFFPEKILNAASLSPNGILLNGENLPTVGVWIMPDNQSKGYLEHFLAALIHEDDTLWNHAQTTVDELMEKDFCKFKEVQKQKALVHTWLAWQKKPGLPFGTAADAGYFNVNSAAVEPFLNWFKKTFELS
ncbi:MAG TPA: hypothetical protein ENJ95_21585 [Bacteroidetes bacterium]|nr:hypothetical protein [Bacteroidota bacterium]